MNKQEQEAIMRIKESLNEFPDNRMAQQVTSEDLRILIRLLEKNAKKQPHNIPRATNSMLQGEGYTGLGAFISLILS